MRQVLLGCGVKTWGAFVPGAVLATVEADETKILFQSHENRGAREAFQPMGVEPITVEVTAPNERVGAAAMQALKAAALSETV